MIITAGGILVSATLLAFLLLETVVDYLSAFNISFVSLGFKRKETSLPEPVYAGSSPAVQF